jgi:subtilisin family serine protease
MVAKLLAAILPLLLAQAAQAQVAVPSVGVLPGLPGGGLPSVGLPGSGLSVNANRALPALGSDLDPRRLQDLRQLRVLELIRSHPKVIEADPNGAPVLRSEVLAFSPSDALLEKLRAAGFSVLRERALEGLDGRIVVLKAPDGMSTRRALKRLKALDPEGVYDFNHVYTDSGLISNSIIADQTADAGGTPAQTAASVSGTASAGLVDSGVDTTHPVFRDIVIHQHGCGGTPVPAAHGTAVASLMIGRSPRFHGAAPGSELYAADVYCGLPTGGAVDAVADALAWLVREHVPVINVSLVGPPNVMLENVVRMVIARGHVIVAAVGNDGPAAPPLYPASYPDVVGVTAVDAHQRALIEAGRGRQVKFAAPGADMAAANPSQTFASVRGTSFASPIVAGLLTQQLHEPNKAAAEQAIADLARRALDLGAPGPDPIYGFGLVGGDLRPETALVGSASN